MAEFQEMVREFHRLCETQRKLHKNICDKCPIKIATMGTMFQCYCYVLEKPKEAENIIMSWAAEHPEPVYPMWCEWLAEKGVVDVARMPVDYLGGIVTEIKPSGKMYEHISADIAEKLEIEPKEG